jgi:L-fuculose-phosphate aldolase
MTAQHPGAAPATEQDDLALRQQLVAAMQELDARGLNRGSTGNASVRGVQRPGGFWVTPTGMSAADLAPDRLAWVGDNGQVQGAWQPSSEWGLHQGAYQGRADVGAVLHTHSVHATALACQQRGLPPFHYMVAVAGGHDVPCVPYHLFGSPALAQAVGAALATRNACLMAHHGLVATGRSMAQALKVVLEVESLCQVYLQALALGPVPLLSAAQMDEVVEQFRGYGQARRSA